MGYKALIILNIVLLAVIARLVFKPLSPAPGIRVWEGETWTAAQYGSRYILSIKNHSELASAITSFAKARGITSGSIYGIGAVNSATLRFFDPSTKKYIDKTFDGQMEIANLTGNITDLARVCEIAERHSLRLIVDAAQTAGILPIDVQKSGIDVLCFSGHKGLLGPQGTGGIYDRPELSIRPLKMGGSGIRSYEKEQPAAMPEHLEAGTLNVHGIAGLLGALEYLEKTGIEMIYKRERELMHLFLEEIQGIPGLTLYGTDDLQQRVPTAALNIGSCDSGYVSDWLYENYGIAVRSGAHCAPLMHEALGTREQGAVRFSFSHVLTEEEVRIAAQALREFAEEEMQQ